MIAASDPTAFDQLFQHADAGLALVGGEGLLEEVNEAFANCVGRSVAQLKGVPVSSLLPVGSVTGQKHQALPPEWHYSRDGHEVRITCKPIDGGRLVLTAFPATSPEAANRLLGLQESLSLAMQGGRLGVWTRDLRTGRVEWSRELEQIFGLEEGTFASNEAAFFELVHPEDHAKLAAAVQGSIETGRDYQVEFRFKKADGTEGWMDGRGRTVLDASGRPLLLAGVGIDITEQKQSELELRSLNQAASLLGSTLDLPLIYDRLQTLIAGILDCDNMLVSSYNPETNMVSCSYAWMEGSRADVSVIPPVPLAPEGRGMQSTVIRTGEPLLINDMAEGRKLSQNSVYIDSDGTVRDEPRQDKPFTQSAIMVPIKLEGKVTGVVQVMSDRLDAYTPDQVRLLEGMVNQMAAAVQNAQLYEQLEQRVRDRTAELALAYAEMQGFTYSVSHDLRAPLRSIISAAMILIEDYGDQVDEPAQLELRRMAKAASKMGQLIDDLLQYSRLGRTELEKRPVDLSAFAAEVVESLSPRHPRSMEVEIEPGMETHADPLLLRLALENLVDNAYKYAGSAGTGRLWIGRRDDAFFVRDNGIGFDPQYSQRIFEPFQRLVLESEFPGTGIGLANVKRIIERHGGRVWAESEPGAGATFFFMLGGQA